MRIPLLKNFKALTAIIIAVALLVSGAGVYAITVGVEKVEAVNTDFVENFEDGTVGQVVSDWTKTAMETNLTKTTDEARAAGFLANNALVTEEENGNKVAAVKKTGAGYVAATSGKIPVDAGATYKFSVDYMTAMPTGVDGTEDRANYNGVGIVIGEINAAGTETLKNLSIDYVYHNSWHNFSVDYTIKADTKNVVIYLWSGSKYNFNITTYFDNVSLTRDKEMSVYNGDFQQGRVGYAAPGWTKVAIANNTKEKITEESYLKAYNVLTVNNNGDKVLSVEKTGSGYIGMASTPVRIGAGTEYILTFDYYLKSYSVKSGSNPGDAGTKYLGTALLVEEFDKDGKSLAVNNKLTTLYSDHVNVTEADTEWKSSMVSYTPSSSAATAVFYLYSGGEYKMYSTVYFDNLEIKAAKDYKTVYNNTFDKVTYKADGGRAAGTAGPTGWTMYSSLNTGALGTDAYNENYVASVVNDNGNKVLKFEGKNDKTQGYATVMSPFVAVKAGVEFSSSYDYKIEGTACDDYGSYIVYYFYDANKNYIKCYHPTGIDKNNAGKGWQTQYDDYSDMKTPVNAAYMKVGFWNGGRWNGAQTCDYYYDNLSITFDGELDYWTEEPCYEGGNPTTNVAHKDNYDIRKIADGADHAEALNLYVSRSAGVGGGVVYYSKAIPVTAGAGYTTSFDSKIENSVPQSQVNLLGASYILRWLKSDGTELARKDLTGRRFDNMGWTHYEYDVTAPEGAVAVQVGLVIGSYNWNVCPDLEYSYDNIMFLESEAYDQNTEDPSVVNSVLYKKTALFVGDAIGSAMSAKAANYSKMQVTDLCGDTSVAEQLASLTETAYNYMVISVGDKQIKESIPAGEVTADTIYMNGAPFDTSTFAGLLEQTFAEVTEYTEPEHIIYVLPTNNADYKGVAQAACAKWGVSLVVLADTSNADSNWQETIVPAETAPVFDTFAVPGLNTYLSKQAENVATAGLSFEARDVLEEIINKAEKCPADHANYNAFVSVIGDVNAVLARYSEYSPLILGATIADGDPNQLRFVAQSPVRALSSGITVSKMGILVMPVSDLAKDGAELVIGNAFATDISATYSDINTMYYGAICGESVAPECEYAAVAYIVYVENGKEYVFYSTNDYENSLGTITANDGKTVKSVYGIAKDIALLLIAEAEDKVDFTAIGSADNKDSIASATVDSEVSLLDVYHLVCDNADLVSEILE